MHAETGIDLWFLAKLRRIVRMERELAEKPLTPLLLRRAKRMGCSDQRIEQLTGFSPDTGPAGSKGGLAIRELRRRWGILPSYKMVDTCAAEFEARTPYFYSTYETENEAGPLPGSGAVVLGSGPIRIGQGIEFDYCSVRAALELRSAGVGSILVNSNPETVSTDFDTSDRLYFEPLDVESVLDILENESGGGGPPPVITQFGGQTAIGLAGSLAAYGITLLGTSVESIDLAEDRYRFDTLMEKLGIPRPRGAAVRTVEEALQTARTIGYPVLVRPSYVLGGRAMEIVRSEESLERYVTWVVAQFGEHPILIDRYLVGREVEVDAISDGQEVLIPGIMEHIERAGVHSGDSFAVYPARSLSQDEIAAVADYTRLIAGEMDIRGLINVQFVLTGPGEESGGRNVFILEVNPRASRTVPFLSKVTGVPIVPLATRVMLGESLGQLGYGGLTRGLWPRQPLSAVKGPVFSMAKITGGEMALSPEMKSTGEVLGVDATYPAALKKALIAAHIDIPVEKGVAFVSLADRDKEEALPILRRLDAAGYTFYATPGTATYLSGQSMEAASVNHISTGDDTILQLIRHRRVQLVLNTITGSGGKPRAHEGTEILDGFEIRRAAVETGIPCLTSLDTARAVVEALHDGGNYHVLPIGDYRRIGRTPTTMRLSR
jgi:carbamoyl-phosphate synthase large subunit